MKLKKIAQLTVCNVLCAAFALGGVFSLNANLSASAQNSLYETVAEVDYFAESVQTSKGATAESGSVSIPSATWDSTEKTIVLSDSVKSTFKGLILTGGEDATFDLGSVDLRENRYKSDSENDPFIRFAIAPQETSTVAEFKQLWITLTDLANRKNSIKIRFFRGSAANLPLYADATASINTAKGTSAQAGFAATRSTKEITPGEEEGVLYSATTIDTAKRAPFLGATTDCALTYDGELNALYATTNFAASACGYTSLIRNFSKEYTVYTKNPNASTNPGTVVEETVSTCQFSGRFNVSVTFDDFESGFTQSSVVITGFNGSDFTDETEISVPKKQYETVENFASSVSVSDWATASYGTKQLYNVQDGKGYATEYSGLVLTGGSGASFTFDTPINLKDYSWKNANQYNSFIDFVFAPSDEYYKYDRQKLAEADEKLATVEASLAEAEAAVGAELLTEKRDAVTLANENLEAANEALKKANSDKKSAENALKAAQEELQWANWDLADAEAALEKLQAENTDGALDEEIAAAQADVATYQANVTACEEAVAAAKQKYEVDAPAAIAAAETAVAEAQEALETAQADLEAIEKPDEENSVGYWANQVELATAERKTVMDSLNQQKPEIMYFTITLTDANNPNNKVIISLTQSNYTYDAYTSPKSNLTTYAQYVDGNGVLQIQQTGTYRLNKGVEEFSSNGVLVYAGRKGNARSPLSLVYDWEKNALYTPNTYYTNSYLLRDYDESYVDYVVPNKLTADTGITFPGFSTGEVYVSLSYDNALAESSVVVTSFAGHDLQNGEFRVSRANDIIELNTNKLVYGYGEEIVLPTVTSFTNDIFGETEFVGNYAILNDSGIVMSGTYTEKLTANDLPIGKYVVQYTSIYGVAKSAELEINPMLTITGDRAKAYVDGTIFNEPYNLEKDAIVEIVPDEGYKIVSLKVNGTEYDTDRTTLRYGDWDKNVEIETTVAPIIYIIEFAVYGEFSEDVSIDRMFYIESMRNTVELPTPSIEGYSFLGWYDGNVRIESGKELPLKAATERYIKLVGVFGREQYRIYYYENGVNGDLSRVHSVAKGGVATTYVPTRNGYVFDGWYTIDNEKMDFSQSITQDITLCAVWKPISTIEGAEGAEESILLNTTDVYGETRSIGVLDIVMLAFAGVTFFGGIGIVFIKVKNKNGGKNR